MQWPTRSGSHEFGKTESRNMRTGKSANLSLQPTPKRPARLSFALNVGQSRETRRVPEPTQPVMRPGRPGTHITLHLAEKKQLLVGRVATSGSYPTPGCDNARQSGAYPWRIGRSGCDQRELPDTGLRQRTAIRGLSPDRQGMPRTPRPCMLTLRFGKGGLS